MGTHIAAQQIDQSLGMAVAVFQAGGLLQLALGAHSAAQHRVHKPRGGALKAAILLCQCHRFIDSGAVRDLVQFIDLIQAQMQDIPHHRMQILNLARQQLGQEKVQQVSVLQHAIAQPGSKGSVPSVQAVPCDIIFQHAIRPGRLLAAGDQGIQCRLSCAHNNPSSSWGWPRK